MRLIKQYIAILSILLNVDTSLAQTKLPSNEYLITILDSIVVNNMEEYNIPGVAYAIVKNKEIVHVGTQGFADLEKQELVANDTKFMLGSIAKLFTTIAVLQLYEKGEVELDIDINEYVKGFEIPYKVTLRQLLTHTGGLEESVLERVKTSENNFLLMEQYLKTHLPEQILEPGKYAAYSNHGMALAGLVVQDVSGVLFEDYIEKFILKPLEMNNSSFKLDENSKQNLAKPYLYKNRELVPTHLEYVQTSPSAMLIGSAEDFSKFMLFNLNPDNFNILRPETLRLMHTNQYQPHPRVWGRGFGFFERYYRGRKMVEHGGSRNGFYSKMTLIPEDSLSLFITFNGGKSRFRETVIFAFLRSIYDKRKVDKKFDSTQNDLSEYEGTYLSNRRPGTDFTKLILQSSFVEKIDIANKDEKIIQMLGSEYQMLSKDQFEISDDSTSSFPIAFGRNKDGAIETLFLPGRAESYQKMVWYQYEYLGIVVFTGAFIMFLVTTITGFINMKKGRIEFQLWAYNNAFKSHKLLYGTINILFLTSLIIVLLLNGESLQYKVPTLLYPIFSMVIIGLIVAILMVYHFIRSWFNSNNKAKLINGSYLLLCVIYTWQLYYWNFIGFYF